MPWFLRLFVLLLFVIFGPIHAFASNYHRSKKITLEEFVVVKEFASAMYEAGIGTLMTPPLGYLSPAVQQTQEMLTAMVHELAPSLKADGVHVVVNIYASPTMNAFVRQMNPMVEGSREHWWINKDRFSRKPWPLRKAWGFPNDGKPIYEIGITSALIEVLKTKDALAFPLGHEIKHLTEGHTDPKQKLSEIARHWWDSQAREGVADTGSIEYMIGKYELEAALTVLELLHPLIEDQNQLREAVYKALNHSAAAHHAEGVRFTFVQALISALRAQKEDAAKRPETPLPEFVDQFKREARLRIKVKPTWWVGQFEHLFENIERNHQSKKDRINNLLQSITSHLPPGSKDPLGLLSPEMRYKLKKFMIENSVGEGAWTVEEFLKDYRKQWSIRTGVIGLFMSSQEGMKFLADLGQISPEWKKFANLWSSLDSFRKSNGLSFYELRDYVENLGAHNPLKMLEPVRLQLQAQLIKAIAEANPAQFRNYDTSGVGSFHDFLLESLEQTELSKRDPAWLLQLQKAFEPHVSEYTEYALKNIRQEGILKNKNGLFIKYFSPSQLSEALEIVEKEIAAVEHKVYSSDSTPDTFFILGELLKKYQNDPKMLWILIKKTYWLRDDEGIRKILIQSAARMTKSQIFEDVVNLYHGTDAKFLDLWLASPQGRKIIADLSFEDMIKLFHSFAVVGYDDSMTMQHIEKLGPPTEQLFILLSKYFKQYENNSDLIRIYVRLTQLGGRGFMLHPRLLPLFKPQLIKALSKLPISERIKQLKQKELWLVLGPEYVGSQVALYARSRTEPDLAERVKKAMEEIPLQKDWTEAFRFFRQNFSQFMHLQPANIYQVFPRDERSDTERASDHDTLVRALSAFSTFVRDLELQKQIEAIEYMMGRQDQFPDDFERASQIIEKDLGGSFGQMVLKGVDPRGSFLQLREKLQFQGPLERAFAINTVIAGSNSIISTPAGLTQVMEHILAPVSEENKPMARTILRALLKAEGRNKALILSYILAQKPSGGDNKMTEAMVLRSLLDFYGVPGVKLAQYLAFTSSFKNFTSALESYQNAAMPISFYDALVLIQKHLGEQWDPNKYRITGILGSGSVNIAIEYENLETGKLEVLTISRDQIETKTKDDFRRFRALIEAAMESEDRDKLEFLIGLLRIIQKSVSLEFNKDHAYKMQKGVHQIYRRYVDEWRIQSVDAYEVMGDVGIRMQKAPGVGATDLLHQDPENYKSAMRALMTVEYEILRGVAGKETSPIPLYANPDFHNGQVLIDVERRTVTILDFGQVVEISNAEREFALDFLMVIAKAVDENAAMKLLQKNIKLFSGQDIQLDQKELSKILKRGDRMETFVYLLSYLERSGFEAPLPVVHWLLGAHRLAKLGEKIGVSLESSFTWMLGMRKFGVPLSVFNAGKVVLDQVSTSRPREGSAAHAPAAVRCEQLFISAD